MVGLTKLHIVNLTYIYMLEEHLDCGVHVCLSCVFIIFLEHL